MFNRQLQRRTGYQNLMVDHFNSGIRVQKLGNIYLGLNRLLFGIENIAVIWLGALFILDGGFSVGMLFAFISFKAQFTSRIGSYSKKGIEFKMLGLHTERVADIALTEPDIERFNSSGHADVVASIQIRNLEFSYAPSEPAVLQNLNLAIAEGEAVAIIGPSGYGKTTLAKLILGLLRPTQGEILIGDMGTGSSGGQKQRVLLARALYKRPKILVLDEATSHLDVAREKSVNAAIQQLQLTRIIIAHRPETIASVDRIIDLQAMAEQTLADRHPVSRAA